MSSVAEEARDLIDLVADAVDAHSERKQRYWAGRQVIVDYYAENPKSTYAVSQASKYLLLRVRELVEEAA